MRPDCRADEARHTLWIDGSATAPASLEGSRDENAIRDAEHLDHIRRVHSAGGENGDRSSPLLHGGDCLDRTRLARSRSGHEEGVRQTSLDRVGGSLANGPASQRSAMFDVDVREDRNPFRP